MSFFQCCISYLGRWFLNIIIFSSTSQMAKILHQVLFPPQNKKDVHGLEQVQGRMLVCPGTEHVIHVETCRNWAWWTGQKMSEWTSPKRRWRRESRVFSEGTKGKWETTGANRRTGNSDRKWDGWKTSTGTNTQWKRLLQRLGKLTHFQDSTAQSP